MLLFIYRDVLKNQVLARLSLPLGTLLTEADKVFTAETGITDVEKKRHIAVEILKKS